MAADIEVDTETLQFLHSKLAEYRNELTTASLNMNQTLSDVSTDLEGAQFDRANEEIGDSLRITNISTENVSRMQEFLNKCMQDLERYFACKY